ncbi:MAG: terminase family protein [Mesorhizobium sp.]|nr:terminase family protein [Mesorhizobium sp.]MBL8578099.1 terminase family protein [Mesorhizobium sp.]
MLESLNSSERRELLLLLEEQERRKSRNRLANYQPYAKQRTFHIAGAEHRERLFMAGNQLGKTLAGGAEWAMHLSGRYPNWWDGKVFRKPVAMWAAGLTGGSTRDTVQKMLVGDPAKKSEWGTGMIPGDAIVDTFPSRGIPNALDSIVVRHGGGGDIQAGQSVLGFKSYEMGREKWQGPTLDGVWFDEEPPQDIYSEGLTRTNATGGITMITFTPLLGMSEVVLMFLTPEQVEAMVKAKR